VFSDYIASVLPELGEEHICKCSFRESAEVQLEDYRHPRAAEKLSVRSAARIFKIGKKCVGYENFP